LVHCQVRQEHRAERRQGWLGRGFKVTTHDSFIPLPCRAGPLSVLAPSTSEPSMSSLANRRYGVQSHVSGTLRRVTVEG
jgi:hypothetical protein